MKKIGKLFLAIACMVVLVLFSGCGVYDEIDLEKTKKDLELLKTTEFDLEKVVQVLEDEKYASKLDDVEEEDLEKYNINKEYIAKENGKLLYSFKRITETEEVSLSLYSYIIVKPAEDTKELLIEQLDNYYQKLYDEYSEMEDATDEMKEHLDNVMKDEYGDYLIYILMDNNKEIFDVIKENCHSLLFENTRELALEETLNILALDKKDIVEHQVFLSTDDKEANLYMIVKPRRQSLEKVKKELDNYVNKVVNEEYEIMNEKMNTEIGGYLVYIISKDNEEVLNTIKTAVVKKD